MCYTANTGRSHFEERLVVIGATREEIAAGCLAYQEGRDAAGAGKRRKDGTEGKPGAGKIAFLFTGFAAGQGLPFAGMGDDLYETVPGFKAILDRCDDVLKGKLEKTFT